MAARVLVAPLRFEWSRIRKCPSDRIGIWRHGRIGAHLPEPQPRTSTPGRLRTRHVYCSSTRSVSTSISSRCALQLERAAECFEQALAVNPLVASCWFTLGCVRLQQRSFDGFYQSFKLQVKNSASRIN